MIDTPDVFDPAVIAEASQVAGAVHAFAAAREWIGHETFGGQAGAEQIATGDAVAGQVQFGRHAQRRLLQLTIKQVRRGVDQRPADVRQTTQFAAGAGRIGGVFRRPVQVVDVLHRRLAVERVDQALLQWLAGEVDNAHARRNLPGALQRGNRRRHGVDQAHLIALRQVRQFQGIARHDDRAAACEGDEDLPHRQVEAHRSRRQYTLQIVFAVDLGGPVNQRLHVAMGNGHAFRLAGRAGGVDHVGQIGRISPRRKIVRRLLGKCCTTRLDQHHLRIGLRQLRQQRLLREQDFRLTVVEHVGHAIRRVIRVQRHIGATGLEHRHQGNDQLRRTRHRHAYTDFRTDTQCDKMMSQLVGALIELGIAQGDAGMTQRQCLRMCRDATFKTLRDQPLSRIRGLMVVPLRQGLAFGEWQQAGLTEQTLRRLDELTQHFFQMPRQT
ncbi:hypothetical protein D3C81_924650 [compost metagenome]